MSLLDATQINPPPVRLGRTGLIVVYLVFLAVVVRTLALEDIRPLLPIYLIVEFLFLFLYTAVITTSSLPAWLLDLYFALQSSLILWLISFFPEFDFLILLFLLLSLQATLVYRGRKLWIWVGIFAFLSGSSLIYFLGPTRGLALSLTTITAEFVIPAYLIVYSENEHARCRSQALLAELQAANQRLQSYADQVEDLSAVQERNRLARQLHDTVSQQIFSISLNARSAQVLLDTDPSRLPGLMDRLQALTSEALSQLRSLITQLRPPQNPEQTDHLIATSKDLSP
jgi:signal transduction histidine kinase